VTSPTLRFWAGGFLYDRGSKSVLLHKRDGNTPINPHRWAFFGGMNEGTESHLQCFIRELHEEIGLSVSPREARKLTDYFYPERNQHRAVYFVERIVSLEELTLGEGAGFAWIELKNVFEFDLADRTREDLLYFIQTAA